MVRASLASEIKRIDRRSGFGHEGSFGQTGPLCDLYPCFYRAWARSGVDAQYDAASAYIKSQAHAGWTLIRSRYDDGGYSGGSTDRPDLQRLDTVVRLENGKEWLASVKERQKPPLKYEPPRLMGVTS
jgi:hypothetical protein